MKKCIVFPKISDFKSVIHDIVKIGTFVGLNESGSAIYDQTKILPTIRFEGTIKLHGTNSGVSYNKESGIWYQSHGGIITPLKDNYGFAFFADQNKESFMNIINQVYIDNDLGEEFTVSVYGEWAGKGVQKSVGISEIDKAFFLFGIKISKPQDDEFNSYWVNCKKYSDVEHKIYNVNDFKTFAINIDFNNPKQHVNDLIDITSKVEQECPVAKHFGVSGIGEGVVWVATYNNATFRFKVKGEKHSVTKIKKLVEVDVVKLKSVDDFIDYAVTENRIDQAISVVCCGKALEKYMLADIIRWVIKDVLLEESNALVENNLEPKDISKMVSDKTRRVFFKRYEGQF